MATPAASRRGMTRSFGRGWHRPPGAVRFGPVRAATNRGRLAGAALAVLVLTLAVSETSSLAAAPGACAEPRASAGHAARVARVLRSGRDVWGEQLLRSASGPTYGAAASLLPPLLYARAPGKKALTDSGVYYLPFGQPQGVQGAGTVALHVADGSQVIANRVGERSVTVLVGPAGKERYGTCLRRLAPARLADGHLPILETGYVDAAGNRYRQESFAAQDAKAGGLASFIRLEVDARTRASRAATADEGPRARLPRARRHDDDLRGLAQPPAPRPGLRGRPGSVRRRSGRPRRVLEQAARGGRPGDGPRGAGERRDAQPADPEPDADLPLQHRQPLRAVLVPGGGGRRAGDGRVGPARRRPLDPADVSDPEGDAVSELEDGREARRLRALLPALGRPGVRAPDHGEAARLRRGSRPPDHDRPRRPARPRALLVGHPGLGLRAALAGRRLAGPARDGPCLGRDRQPRARPARAASSPPGSRAAYGGRSACRSAACRTAPSSSPPS